MIQQDNQQANRKIAILILVHKDDKQVYRLINHLSKDFDIYVHIDKKSSVKIKKTENVFAFKKYKIYWGAFEMAAATVFLLKQAYLKKYDRYLLISGQDLPLKTNHQIAEFFVNNDTEYIEADKMPARRRPGSNGELERVTMYWANRFHHRTESKWLKYLQYAVQYGFRIITKINPRPVDYEFYEGSQWINFTHKCVEKMFEYLDRNPQYIKRFKWTAAPDEIFFQTLIKQLTGLKIINENLRYVNWIDGPEYPRLLRKNDYEKIMSSNKLFARKFDIDRDNEIIEMIYQEIKN